MVLGKIFPSFPTLQIWPKTMLTIFQVIKYWVESVIFQTDKQRWGRINIKCHFKTLMLCGVQVLCFTRVYIIHLKREKHYYDLQHFQWYIFWKKKTASLTWTFNTSFFIYIFKECKRNICIFFSTVPVQVSYGLPKLVIHRGCMYQIWMTAT